LGRDEHKRGEEGGHQRAPTKLPPGGWQDSAAALSPRPVPPSLSPGPRRL